MLATDTSILSVYRPLTMLDSEHSVSLVQHIHSKKLYVKKELSIYSRPVYDYIRQNPIPNMPYIFELVESDGILTVIEEYICGDTLQFLLDNHGLYSEAEVIKLALQLCTILHQLHSASPAIVHRDIKPSNIIISPDGVLKLLDINAAKQYSPSQNQDTRMMGTIGYAAPEQYGFMQSSVQSDIYAVGALMNVLLTGKLPSKQLSSGRLTTIIKKCVEIAPKDRYPSVDELAAALSKLQNSHSVSSPSESYKYAWQKYLPPGLRSLKLPNMAFAALGYLFIFSITTSLEVQGGSAKSLLINRIGATAAAVLIILFSGNYLQIQTQFPITKSRNSFVRLLGIILYDILILFLIVVLVGIAES